MLFKTIYSGYRVVWRRCLSNMENNHPVVTVSEGSLRGKVRRTAKGTTFYSYQGIPYAKPPVGALRFQPPVPYGPWEGVRDALKEGPSCPQINMLKNKYEGNEDCLYLNVYTTQAPGERQTKDAVLLLIPGGAFMHGSSSSDQFGPDYFMDEKTVFVSFNYRVGVLGFLSTEDEVCPGNNGMRDQLMVMKWVKKNIEAFGGDPDNITLFGVSAGGSSVHLHMLSPMSKGLFNKAISQSGVALSDWVVTQQARRKAFQLGEFLGFKAKDSVELVNSLRTVDVTQIYEAVPKFRKYLHIFVIPFCPVVERKRETNEDVFLPEHPIELIRLNQVNHVPWLLGITSHEGIFTAAQFVMDPDFVKQLGENFEQMAPNHFWYDESKHCKEINRRIKEFYFGNKPVGPEQMDKFIEVDSDMKFTAGTAMAAKIHAKENPFPIYLYHVSYQGEHSLLKFVGVRNVKGVAHTDDMTYVFKSKMFGDKLNASDRKISDRFVTMWVNFAKYGNPTPETSELLPVIWEPTQAQSMAYLDIGVELRMKNNFFGHKMKFWESLTQLIEDRVKTIHVHQSKM